MEEQVEPSALAASSSTVDDGGGGVVLASQQQAQAVPAASSSISTSGGSSPFPSSEEPETSEPGSPPENIMSRPDERGFPHDERSRSRGRVVLRGGLRYFPKHLRRAASLVCWEVDRLVGSGVWRCAVWSCIRLVVVLYFTRIRLVFY